MRYTIDTTKNNPINLQPATVYEEVIQNLWFLLSSTECDIPLDRGFGINVTCIDKPLDTAKALISTELYEKIEKYEPRAEIVSMDFSVDYGNGIIKPIVEVDINGDYTDEEYTE